MDSNQEKPPPYQEGSAGVAYLPPGAYQVPQGRADPSLQGGPNAPPQYPPAPGEGGYRPPPQQAGAYPPPPQPSGYPPPTGYAPVQPGYTPQPAQPGYAPQPGQTVVVQQPGVLLQGIVRFGELPQNIVCPSCQHSVVTSIFYTAGTWTFLLTLILCLVFWPCAWIPCVMDGTKDVTHQCPNCHNVVGHFRRI